MDRTDYQGNKIPYKCDNCGERLPVKICESNAGYYVGMACPICGPYARISGYMSYDQCLEYIKEYKNLL